MADRVSSRRVEANKYYSAILTGLFAALSFITEKDTFQTPEENIILLGTSILSIATCILWFANIRSYGVLNAAKFEVIHEMEKKLAFASFDKEWEILHHEQRKNRHVEFTTVERLTPLVFLLLYVCLMIYSICHLLQ